MTALVAVASRHGSTREIADAIAAELRAAGIDTDLKEVTAVGDATIYDAIVLGSAVYMGNWLPEARTWAMRHQAELANRPLWLFSSGPLGSDDPQPKDQLTSVVTLAAESGAREHRVFAGKLDPSTLGVRERLVTRVVHPPQGDFRDWEAIRGWARQIAAELEARTE